MTAAKTLGDLAPYMTSNINTNNFTFSSTQQFDGNTTIMASIFANIVEKATISSTSCAGNVNVTVTSQGVSLYTTAASANWSFRLGSSGNSINNLLATGQSLSMAMLVTQGSPAYYSSNIIIDNATINPKWQGGSAPTSGNTNSVDAYSYVIIKTAPSTYNVFASQTKFG